MPPPVASPTSETVYVDELFEQVTTAGAKEFRYYVHSPERAIAIVTRGGSDPGTKYLHVDHLGSVESVTKDDGTIEEKRSYDAFGAKRNPKWGDAGGIATSKITKGFTGHEEDDEFGLVNMKGRLFDPRMARFTTPDPVIPDIFDGQSFNAFSYVWNNPLSFVDPSGFDPEEPPILPIEQRITTYADGSITVDLLYPPRDGQPQKTLPPLDTSAAVGAVLASADMATTGVAGAAKAAKEGVSSFFEGLLLGSLSDNTSWSATAGSVIGGFIPGVGIVTDVRDFGVAIAHVANGDDGAWLELGASIVGFIPGGDIAKAAVKGATKATKAAAKAAKAGANVAGDAGKVVKGSTAAAADGLSGAQKGAGKVNAPRGPPSPTTNAPKKRGGDSPQAAKGRYEHEKLKEKVATKKGWDPKPTLYDSNGRKLHPDALTPNKNPIELKPNTPSGRAAGKRQIKKYEAASNGKKGRVIYYDP